MADIERRRGMDEVSEKIGGLNAGFAALNQRLDGLALERQQQHIEAIKLLTDTAAQYHEIKHRLDNNSSKFDAIDRKIERYGETLERHVEDDGKQFAKHEDSMRASSEALGKEVIANRDVAAARDASIMARIDDLFAWRNLVRGVWAALSAIAGGLLVVFGHDILEFGKGIVHWGGGK